MSTPIAELVEASRAGKVDAFRQIVRRYQNVVCSVAYSRTGDRQLSEDIGQDTFLAAWKGLETVKEPEHLGSWLCGIARNLSGKAMRKGRREVVSDGLEANASGAPSPLDAMIDDESEQLVWQSLEALPENLREPLVLFYREDQSVREVASGLGISEDTAKQRLSRGRKALKAGVSDIVENALRRSRPGKRFTAVVVAAIAAHVAGATAASAASAASKSSVASSGGKGVWLAIGAAVLVVGGGVAIHRASTSSSDEVTTSGAPSQKNAAFAQLLARRQKLAAAESGPCELRGTVRADGAPLASATVTIQSASASTLGASAETLELETDADGSWSATAGPGEHWVGVSANGRLAQTERVICGRDGARAISMELPAGGVSLAGTIRDLNGGPIAGATIAAVSPAESDSPRLARSRDDGTFVIGLEPKRYVFTVQHDQYAVENRMILLTSDRAGEDFALLPGAVIEGVVLDAETDQPIAGAFVRTGAIDLAGGQLRRSRAATVASALVPVVSDERGRFRMTGIGEGAVELIASSAKRSTRRSVRVELGVGETVPDIQLRLEKTPRVSGFVTHPGDPSRGVADASVVLMGSEGLGSSFKMPTAAGYAITDTSGYFEISAGSTGTYRLIASSPIGSANIEVHVDEEMGTNVIVPLETGTTIEGRLDPPLAATIRLEPQEYNRTTVSRAQTTSADSSGRFRLSNVVAGDYVVVAGAVTHVGDKAIASPIHP